MNEWMFEAIWCLGYTLGIKFLIVKINTNIHLIINLYGVVILGNYNLLIIQLRLGIKETNQWMNEWMNVKAIWRLWYTPGIKCKNSKKYNIHLIPNPNGIVILGNHKYLINHIGLNIKETNLIYL